MGCLIYGIVTLFIGAAICVALGLEGDSAGGMFIIFLCFFGPIIALTIKGFADEAERNRIAEEKRRIEEKARLEKIAQEEAKQKEERAKAQVEKISSKYNLNDYRIPRRKVGQEKQNARIGNLALPRANRDVSVCFQRYHEDLCRIDSQIEELQNKAKSILNCTASSNENKLKILEPKIHELEQIKENADRLYFEGRNKSIHLTYFDSIALTNLRKAILALQNSKKCISISGSSTKEFFISKEPKEHSYFHSSTAPVVLNFGDVKAYCYPKIILLFDGDYFIGATNPDGLKIVVTQKEVRARYNADRKEYNDNKILAEDSFVVQKGYDRTTWLHTCKDGSPDLRYSYNPAMHYRDDVVRHGVVVFSIGEYKAEFAFSSYQAFEDLVLAQRTYCSNNPAVTDPIPMLLELLDSLDANHQIIKDIKNKQSIHGEKTLPVCRIIESRSN